MPLEPVLRLEQLSYAPATLRHLVDRERRANAGDDVLALRVHQEFAVELLLPGGWISRERDAGARVVAEVAEDHRHDAHRGAEILGIRCTFR